MVGGKVIGITRAADRTHVNVQDRNYRDTCCIYIEEKRRSDDTPVQIEVGDSLWWQGRDAMWTPAANRVSCEAGEKLGHKCGVHYDIRLPRIGYSH